MSVDGDFKKAEDKIKAIQTIIKMTAKSVGYMDQGMGHGHYGWIPSSLTQEEFIELHEALETYGAFKEEPCALCGKKTEFGFCEDKNCKLSKHLRNCALAWGSYPPGYICACKEKP